MLQELVAQTGASEWAIASMLFFLGVWVAITARVVRASPEEHEARARLALEGEEDAESGRRGPTPMGASAGSDPGPKA